MKANIPAAVFTRRWVCMVVRSGYHNGAGCSPNDPHDEEAWGCEYRWEASISDEQYQKLSEQSH